MKLAVKAWIHTVSFTCNNTNIVCKSKNKNYCLCTQCVSKHNLKVIPKTTKNKNMSYRWYLYFYSHLETPLPPSQENMTTDYFQLDVIIKLVF